MRGYACGNWLVHEILLSDVGPLNRLEDYYLHLTVIIIWRLLLGLKLSDVKTQSMI